MIVIRRSSDRAYFNHGWLKTWHSFSFADYRDERFMGFRSLRVINEDFVAAGQGFGMHPHRDMEIVTYIVSGTLAHRDSLGNTSTITKGEVQRMTAGEGIVHSEFNPSENEPVHLLQIWIHPNARSLPPGYEQKQFSSEEKRNRLRPIVTPDGREQSLTIHQDASILAGYLEAGTRITHELTPGRHQWLQLIRGELEASGESLAVGDGAALADLQTLELHAPTESELLLFDLD